MYFLMVKINIQKKSENNDFITSKKIPTNEISRLQERLNRLLLKPQESNMIHLSDM